MGARRGLTLLGRPLCRGLVGRREEVGGEPCAAEHRERKPERTQQKHRDDDETENEHPLASLVDRQGTTIPVVDPRSQNLLELDEVRHRLRGYCAFDGGQRLADKLAPATEHATVVQLRRETEEAFALAEIAVSGPGGAHDVREAIAAAARNSVLEIVDLERITATIGVALEVRTAVQAQKEIAPSLAARLEVIDAMALEGLAAVLARALDGRGGLLDAASRELADFRRQLTDARRTAAETLRRLAGRLRNHLQETFTTERSGRPVLAVKASSRSAVPGLVHDSSGSGQTLFIEPFEMVEANNRVRELIASEAIEVQRILAALSARVAADAPALEHAVTALSEHDLALARAHLSHAWRGCVVDDSDEVTLIAVRHPLLDPATAVAIDLPLEGVRALVVSGPNTGGKTVALKTLGLMAMLSQCGLRLPAERARLPVFDHILADIGDDQSIALSLSTFSAHVRTLIDVIATAGPRSLVLLDEVAGGTDPEEGGPLAQAVLERLVANGALVLATTHLGALKEWAAATPGARNAAVGVEAGTLRPLYSLAVGAPGASHALSIARGLGLGEDVIAAARAAMSPARRHVDDLMREAADARAAADDERQRNFEQRRAAEEATRHADERAAELERRLERVGDDAQRERERVRNEAAAELSAATRELADLRTQISSARRAEAKRALGADRGDDRGARERDRRLGAASAAASRAGASIRSATARPPSRPVAVGDSVNDPEMGFRGVVVALEGKTAEVQGDKIRLRVPARRLVVLSGPRPADLTERERPMEARPALVAAPSEIDVRGTRAGEARQQVREAVDAAAMVGRSRLRVIHGHGTGALRVAVRDELKRHPLVERAEAAPPNEGGDGATYAVLEESD